MHTGREKQTDSVSERGGEGERESKVYCRTKWPKRSLPNIKSIDTISARPLTAESIKKI